MPAFADDLLCLVRLSKLVLDQLKSIIREGNVGTLDDTKWPAPGATTQELEIVFDKKHVWLQCPKLSSRRDCESSEDAEGMLRFFYLVEEVKALILSLINIHFKVNPF